MTAAAGGVCIPLAFDSTTPVVGAMYMHTRTEERLMVGAVSHRDRCKWCSSHGKTDDGRRCHVCDGTGRTPGSVVCYHPQDETGRRQKLIWEVEEFMAAFRRADGVGVTAPLFEATA